MSRRTESRALAIRQKKNRRAHKLAQEHLSLSIALSIFDSMTFFRVAVEGTDKAHRARIRTERSREKQRLIARRSAIERDPGYVVFEPYGA